MKTYTVKELSKLLHVNEETVRRWIRDNKLEAIQDSRKHGNVVTEEMLKKFLVATPKFGMLLKELFPGYKFPVIAATSFVEGIVAHNYLKGKKSYDKIKVSELKGKIKSEVKKCKETIRRKEEAIRYFESEIEEEKEKIKELEALLDGFNLSEKEGE